MNVGNTITRKRTTALDQALFVLETLTNPGNIPIIEYLLEHGEVTPLDLSVRFGWEITRLEHRLEVLAETGILYADTTVSGTKYRVDFHRLRQINEIARQIADSE